MRMTIIFDGNNDSDYDDDNYNDDTNILERKMRVMIVTDHDDGSSDEFMG